MEVGDDETELDCVCDGVVDDVDDAELVADDVWDVVGVEDADDEREEDAVVDNEEVAEVV